MKVNSGTGSSETIKLTLLQEKNLRELRAIQNHKDAAKERLNAMSKLTGKLGVKALGMQKKRQRLPLCLLRYMKRRRLKCF